MCDLHNNWNPCALIHQLNFLSSSGKMKLVMMTQQNHITMATVEQSVVIVIRAKQKCVTDSCLFLTSSAELPWHFPRPRPLKHNSDGHLGDVDVGVCTGCTRLLCLQTQDWCLPLPLLQSETHTHTMLLVVLVTVFLFFYIFASLAACDS